MVEHQVGPRPRNQRRKLLHQRSRRIAVLAVGLALSLPLLSNPALAEPTADQVLSDIGLSADDKRRVMNGELVTAQVASVSERDLPVALVVFITKLSPAALATQIMAGDLITADSAVRTYGRFGHPGSLADLAGLTIDRDVAQQLSRARSGEAVNLATQEIAAFNALPSDAPDTVGGQLQKMLLARYQAYRASGLAGIAPYERGASRSTDLASDLRKASQAAVVFEKHMPAFHAVLLGYPQASLPGMRQDFRWVIYDIEGKPTYVLVHLLSAAAGAARAIVQRHYYVSTGYNGQQAVAGFLPVQEGTLAVYAGHAFTDQVTGFGGVLKRGIGRRVIAEKMRQIFETGRTMLAE
jgi:hypothetical protein